MQEIRREKSWLHWRSREEANAINEDLLQLFDYAIRLSSLRKLYDDTLGTDLEIAETIRPFRIWLDGVLAQTRNQKGWRIEQLIAHAIPLKRRLIQARQTLFDAHPALSAERLDKEICQKDLVLVLGGGGGTAYAHLILFQMLAEDKLEPSMIVGTSLGAILGLYRASLRHYDPALTVLEIPTWLELTRRLRPFFGGSRHGMPALFNIDIPRLLEELLGPGTVARFTPRYSELPIPFASVTTGITRSAKSAQRRWRFLPQVRPSLLRFATSPVHSAVDTITGVAKLLTQEPEHLQTITMGFSDDTKDLIATDGTAFSALVPGLLHTEINRVHGSTRAILDDLCDARQIWRFTDGGLVSNVPAKIAHDAVMNGQIQRRNPFIYALDVFGPQADLGALFFPLQQIANNNVVADLPYADAHERLRLVLSPLNLSPTLKQMRKLEDNTRKRIRRSYQTLKRALQPIPPLDISLQII